MNYSGQEIKAGLMIAISIAIFIVLLFVVGNFRAFSETYEVDILFNFISGLEKNAPVRYAGAEVGKVKDIDILESGEDANVKVAISVDSKVKLKTDSEVIIDTLGLMGEKYVEITPGTAQGQTLKPGGTLRGEDPIAMNEVMKKVDAIAGELSTAISTLRDFIDNADHLVTGNEGNINEIFENLKEASENIEELTVDVKKHPWKLFKRDTKTPVTGDKKEKAMSFT